MFPRDSLKRSRAAVLLSLAIAAVFGGACREAPEPLPTGPAGAALRMFEMAAGGEPTRDQLDTLFDPEMSDRDRAGLLDALIVVGTTPDPRVGSALALEGLGRSVVELTADLPGGGQAVYAVHVEPQGDDDWRVRWFGGPGVQWPAAARRRDEGLTTSAPPTAE